MSWGWVGEDAEVEVEGTKRAGMSNKRQGLVAFCS